MTLPPTVQTPTQAREQEQAEWEVEHVRLEQALDTAEDEMTDAYRAWLRSGEWYLPLSLHRLYGVFCDALAACEQHRGGRPIDGQDG